MKQAVILTLSFFLLSVSLQSQELSRLECSFSLKQNTKEGNATLSTGKIYFDKNEKLLIFRVQFPKKQVICINERGLFVFENDSLVHRQTASGMIDFSIFNLFLNGDLPYYGLKKSSYILQSVSTEGNKVITEWLPPETMEEQKGKMLLAQEEKRVVGLISYTPEGKILSKQFFEDYTKVDDYDFPGQVTQFVYHVDWEEIKRSVYTNIRLNNFDNEKDYHFPLLSVLP